MNTHMTPSTHRTILAKSAHRAERLTACAVALGQLYQTDPFVLIRGKRVAVAVRTNKGQRRRVRKEVKP